MANEATQIGVVDKKRSVVVADGTALTIGALMVGSQAAATVHGAATDGFLGVLLDSKAANDGRTSVAIATDGDFEVSTEEAAVTAQDLLFFGATANVLKAMANNLSQQQLKGLVAKALENGSGNRVKARLAGVAV